MRSTYERANSGAHFSKNSIARFKKACGATDRREKSDNVENDDSEKIAERDIVSCVCDRCFGNHRRARSRVRAIGVASCDDSAFPLRSFVLDDFPQMPSACSNHRHSLPPLVRRRHFLPADRQDLPRKILKTQKNLRLLCSAAAFNDWKPRGSL